MLRFLVLFLTVSVAGFFGQTGKPPKSAPVAVLKAGDFAPDVVFTRVVNTPGAAVWSSANLSGQVTVLVFFQDTSHNLQSVTRWNALVDRFAGKPVQFVWITAEEDASLVPWLKEHPVKGWVLEDARGESIRPYGIDFPEAAIIGADRRIIGFDMEFVPSERTVNAAIEGRITTTRPKPGVAEFEAFAKSGRVLLLAEPHRMPDPEDHKPAFPPSYTLHVSPATGEGGNFGGDDFQSFQNYDLKELIAALYDVSSVRVQLPQPLDDGKRYDFALVVPNPEARERLCDRIRQGVQDHFRVTIAREGRMVDAYVVTAQNAKPPAVKPQADDQDFTFSDSYSVEFQVAHRHGESADAPKAVGLADVRGISVEGTIDKFCHALEGSVDRPVVNESNLEGEFEFKVKADGGGPNDFLERLRTKLGIVIAPAQRTVEMVVLKPR